MAVGGASSSSVVGIRRLATLLLVHLLILALFSVVSDASVTNCKSAEQLNRFISSNKLVVIDFFAIWCGPCRVIGPRFQSVSERYPSALFLIVDVDDLPDIASQYGIRGIPTFIFIKNGLKVDELVGADPRALENKVKQLTGDLIASA